MVAHAIRPLQIAAAAAVENEVTAEVVVTEVGHPGRWGIAPPAVGAVVAKKTV